ncbi:putative interferon gamma-inducible protein 30 [Neospora caninum Liverpool]|uniref:Interferon gamma-inducible protein 30, putative n=1 Tax=Neospora caninum (strain Liverpool) TaxID=572307 RepID=F0VCA9_NEOCL|nr:putative interferon gamma-inducible protein 30 [Neospora caninum Liverpool]CBZ51243.1 putative interferon gamma-inducible protein 30 [Neospora caninum Liverpool]CEL68558.1 TPA: interferon gamma-inducible protein 30, putative [Neospora caninum Liverpool]|eukprot:XP_003881276.1 putative interferon gamma-inducible protein 30 [Neospora caninum Liverpool]
MAVRALVHVPLLFLGSLCGVAFGATTQDAVKVEILYESKCPFCFSWLKEELHPVVEQLGADVLQKANIVFDPLPFGNAKEISDGKGGFTFECQHGPTECYLNKVEACGLSIIGRENIKQWSDWLLCVEKSTAFPPDQPAVSSASALSTAEPPLLLGQRLVQQTRFALPSVSSPARSPSAAAAWFAGLSPLRQEQIRQALGSVRSSAEVPRAPDAGSVNLDETPGEKGDKAEGEEGAREEDEKTAALREDNKYEWVLCPVPTRTAFSDLLKIIVCSETPTGDKLVHAAAARTGKHDYVPWIRINGEHSVAAENSLRCGLCRAVDLAKAPVEMQDWCKQHETECMWQQGGSLEGRCYPEENPIRDEQARSLTGGGNDARLRARRQQEA